MNLSKQMQGKCIGQIMLIHKVTLIFMVLHQIWKNAFFSIFPKMLLEKFQIQNKNYSWSCKYGLCNNEHKN